MATAPDCKSGVERQLGSIPRCPTKQIEKMKDYITEGIALIIGFIIGANMLYLAHSDVRATAAKANAAIQKCERELPRSQTCVVSATPN